MIKQIIDVELLNIFKVKASSDPFVHYLGYYIDNEVVGYVEYSIIYDRAEIVNIFVLEEFRNRKIAYFMLEYLVSFLKNKDIINITLEVNTNNTFAIKLYENIGFKKVAIRKGYYDGIDGILMELIL